VALHAGRPFFPADVCAEMETLPRPRVLVTTPVHLRTIIDGSTRLPAVDFMVCATAPLALDLAAAAEKAFGAPLYEMYGCTEAGYVSTRRPTASPDWTLAPGLILRVEGDSTWVKGGHVPGAVRLGDFIDILDSRRFRLIGRTADMINIGGKRSSLAHLNHQLKSIDGVLDGAFVMPDDTDGRVVRLTAFVVAPGLSRRTLMAALRRRIDAAFLPRPLCLVDALPRNETGKLPRSALAALSAQLRAKDR
jgi:acyl-coenzyme A synthetase/AMP-(fatty) acid ligase